VFILITKLIGPPPSWPAWDATQSAFSKVLLSIGIETPPQPGNSPYTGYELGLWNTVRDGIGSMDFNIAPTTGIPTTITIDSLPLTTGYRSKRNGAIEVYEYTPQVTNSEAEPKQVTFSLPVAPEDMEINPQSGAITWIALEKGAFDVTIQVTNRTGHIATQSYTIYVNENASATIRKKVGNAILIEDNTTSNTNVDASTAGIIDITSVVPVVKNTNFGQRSFNVPDPINYGIYL
jgi:hypothetical protein